MKSSHEKAENLLSLIKGFVDSGHYLDTRHVIDRKNERNISRLEIIHVLKNGHHEKRKDTFDTKHKAWNYSIRGKTLERRTLRIIISFDKNYMFIITAINLAKTKI